MAFQKDFEDNVVEIERYFEFLLLIDNLNKIEKVKRLSNFKISINGKNKLPLRTKIDLSGSYTINQELRKILKSTCFLLLYNLIEGSINAALNDYFNAFSLKKQKFKNVKPAIQSVWLKYQYKLFENKKAEDIVEILSSIFDEIVEILPKTVTKDNSSLIIADYKAYIQKINKADISGNIDALKIRELSKLYGFKLPKNDKCNSLLIVKNRRNILAHGEATFMDVGKESIESLIVIKDETIKFIRAVLRAINTSIKNEIFLN